MRHLLLIACALAVPLASHQDPGGSRPSQRRALPPIQEPWRSKVERADLLQEFSSPSPLSGFWSLRSFVREGVPGQARGYVWFGNQHCMLATSISRGGHISPFVESSVRTYRVEGDRIVMTNLVGHDHDNDLRFFAPGVVETREFQQAGTMLRIFQGARDSYMEFVRVE
ncbi:MAG: hypothetical protein KDB80_15250 [Planctomycetes bacterium]|nr:hypothetical protein [Planctomycetota bacterium]